MTRRRHQRFLHFVWRHICGDCAWSLAKKAKCVSRYGSRQ